MDCGVEFGSCSSSSLPLTSFPWKRSDVDDPSYSTSWMDLCIGLCTSTVLLHGRSILRSIPRESSSGSKLSLEFPSPFIDLDRGPYGVNNGTTCAGDSRNSPIFLTQQSLVEKDCLIRHWLLGWTDLFFTMWEVQLESNLNITHDRHTCWGIIFGV